MLKLLDDLEMTDEIKDAFKKKLTKAYLLNDNLEITPDNYLMSIDYRDEKYNPDKGFIGEAVCRSIDIKLNNKDNALDLENQDLEYRIGAKVNSKLNLINLHSLISDVENVFTIGENDYINIKYDNSNNNEPKIINITSSINNRIKSNEDYFVILEKELSKGNASIEIINSIYEISQGYLFQYDNNEIFGDEMYYDFETGELYQNLEEGKTSTLEYLDGYLYENVDIKENIQDLKDIQGYKIVPSNEYGKSSTIQKIKIIIPANNSVEFKFRLSILSEEVDLTDYDYNTYNNIVDFAWISFGNFIVQKPENTDVKEETTFTALDYMSKFDKPYEQRLTLPMTFGALAQDVCDQCGVELGSIEFRNSNKTALTNPFIGGENCREVIKSLARISFSVAYIGQDNKLYFGFEVKNEVDEEVNTDGYFELAPNNAKKPINLVTLRSSEVPAAGISIKDENAINALGEEIELVVEEDYFAYTDEIREELLKEAPALFGLEYIPIEVDLLGSIYLEFNDVIEITNSKGEKRKTYCINNSHTYNGALYNKIASPALTEVEDKYQYQDEAETARRRTAVEIDKANQRISLLTTNVTEQQNKLSEIVIEVDTIREQVSNVVDTTHQLSDANGYIVIEDAIEGELYELHIIGNNIAFSNLYPSPTLYPSPLLYPRNAISQLHVTHYDKEENELTDTYELKINRPLLQLNNVYDEYVLQNGKAKIIRRINEQGTAVLANPYEEDLGEIHIKLYQDKNIVSIKPNIATVILKYVRQNEFSDIYATKIEMNSKIEMTTQSLTLEVSKKLDANEIISAINLSPEMIKISSQKLELEGYFTVNKTFHIDESGSMKCNGGEIGGFTIDKNALYSNAVGMVSHPSEFSGIAFWAGANTGNIGGAPFKVLENGTVYGVGGFICQDTSRYSNLSLSGYITNGTVTASDIVNNSEAELKENIELYEGNATEIINDTDIYTYNYIGKTEPKIGVVIGEGYNTAEEIIVKRINPVTKDISKGIDIYTMTSISWQAHKEQNERILELEKQVKLLLEKLGE